MQGKQRYKSGAESFAEFKNERFYDEEIREWRGDPYNNPRLGYVIFDREERDEWDNPEQILPYQGGYIPPRKLATQMAEILNELVRSLRAERKGEQS